MVEFAGWEMPVQYSGIIEEHAAVRARAGLFDVSHMGEVEVRGPEALDVCQKLTANDVSRIRVGQAQYNLLLNENGGIIDDVVVYRLEPERFLLCVNAANTKKDYEWIREMSGGMAEIVDASSEYVQLALQGPLAEAIVQPLTAIELSQIAPFYFNSGEVASVRCVVARTGYTGEDGFELFCASESGVRLWDALFDAGRNLALLPVGLGARDTLRLERALPLYGHELDESTTPLEAGLAWVVKLSKGPFLGREALLHQKEKGVTRKLVGVELTETGIARGGYKIFKQGRDIGEITSGTKSPTLGRSIAMGYVLTEESQIGNSLDLEIRGRRVGARIVPLPFYSRQAKKGGE